MAALAVVAGVLIARGVLGVPVLAPAAAGNSGDSSTAVYALLAAGCALLATGLLHVLLLGAPRPLSFFVWITGLADVIVAAAPFTQPVRGLRSCELRCVRVTVGHAYPVRPARCRLHHGAANHGTANHGTANSGVADPAATRPARCSDSAVIHGARPMHEPVAYPERARA